MSDNIIVLHEYGATSHYTGLEYKFRNIKYFEIHFFKQFVSGVKNKDVSKIKKSVVNFFFLLSSFMFPALLKKYTIVLGLAPVNFRIIFIRRIVSRSRVIYHSSWTKWNSDDWPHKATLMSTSFLEAIWRDFLTMETTLFANVTKSVSISRNEFLGHHSVKEFTCYHSYDASIFYADKNKESFGNKVIFSGRLVPEKGIMELIDYVLNERQFKLTIAGRGPLSNEISVLATKFPNKLTFLGFVSDKNELASVYRTHDIVILPSIITATWEELFGIAMIEGMACGLIPVIHRHKGPMEVVESSKMLDSLNEEHFSDTLAKFVDMDVGNRIELRDEAIKIADKFSLENIGNRWISE